MALVIGLLAGFAGGRLARQDPALSPDGAVAAGSPGKSRAAASGEAVSGASSASTGPARRGETGSKTSPAERQAAAVPRVSLPLKSVVESLGNAQFGSVNFESLRYRLGDALNLLGVDKAGQEAVIALQKDIETRMKAEEKQRVKVKEVTETAVVLDHSGMLEPASRMATEMQEGIRANLPPDLAQAMIEAVHWENFYMPADQEPVSTFSVVRQTDGLWGQWNYPGGGSGTSTDKRFPDDGTPIPIGEILRDDRWAALLKGHKLLPVDGNY